MDETFKGISINSDSEYISVSNPYIEQLYVENTGIKILVIKNCPKLVSIFITGNKYLKRLQLVNLKSCNHLVIKHNKIESFGIRKCFPKFFRFSNKTTKLIAFNNQTRTRRGNNSNYEVEECYFPTTLANEKRFVFTFLNQYFIEETINELGLPEGLKIVSCYMKRLIYVAKMTYVYNAKFRSIKANCDHVEVLALNKTLIEKLPELKETVILKLKNNPNLKTK